jgi:alkanesulfonate monooxygenase SsuD/methylene tetrahydromethanopterin reductase-like flavin-dependent oxidoreductase (luciferase family)
MMRSLRACTIARYEEGVMVEFGIHLFGQQAGQTPRDLLDQHLAWLRAGEGALTSAWVSDHLESGDRPLLEGWTTLTYLAALAPTYRVGHLVLSQSFRNPSLLAKMAATLQHLTGGRFILGIGAGWRAGEYAAYDYPFPSAGTRIEELREAIDLIRAMWTASPATFAGSHYRVTEARTEPLPDPPPKILIGGQGPKLMRLVAEKADIWVWDMPLEVYRVPYQRLVGHCEEIGRNLSDIRLACEANACYFPANEADFPEPYWSGYLDFMTTPLGPTPEAAFGQLTPLVELGVSEIIVGFGDTATLERFVDEVVPAFR